MENGRFEIRITCHQHDVEEQNSFDASWPFNLLLMYSNYTYFILSTVLYKLAVFFSP